MFFCDVIRLPFWLNSSMGLRPHTLDTCVSSGVCWSFKDGKLIFSPTQTHSTQTQYSVYISHLLPRRPTSDLVVTAKVHTHYTVYISHASPREPTSDLVITANSQLNDDVITERGGSSVMFVRRGDPGVPEVTPGYKRSPLGTRGHRGDDLVSMPPLLGGDMYLGA